MSDLDRGPLPVEVLEGNFPAYTFSYVPPRRRKGLLLALVLLVVTVFSTLAVGAEMEVAYAKGTAAFASEYNPLVPLENAWLHPGVLLLGVPFSFTLMGILLAHELGHYFACRYYRIQASYPYFIPAPTLIGTMGAFIRIRSPIQHRRALFDVGLAGPVVGFILAVPALALGILHSKVAPGAQSNALIVFGNPLLVRLFAAVLRPTVPLNDLLLSPVGRAAWVGLFATALNLLPASQLDGGHVVYSVWGDKHTQISLAVIVILAPLSLLWSGWLMWAILLLLLGFRHPPLLDRSQPLDARRLGWAIVALIIFVLCFTPVPFSIH